MNRTLQYAILSADLLWIAGSFSFVLVVSNERGLGRAGLAALSVHIPAVVVATVVWIVLYFNKKLEGFCRGWHLPSVFAQVTVGVCYLMSVLLLLALCGMVGLSTAELLYTAGLLPLGFTGIRCSAWCFVKLRADRRRTRRVVILGAGRKARELAYKITLHPELLMEVAGVLFPSDSDPARQPSTASSTSLRSLNIVKLLEDNQVQELIVVEPVPPGQETEKLISNCRTAGIRIHLVPQHYELYLSKAELQEIDDVPLLSMEEHKLPVAGMRMKRCIDVAGALLLLTVAGPLLAWVGVAVYLRTGKAFRKELRCGKGGTSFWMCRMNIDRDDEQLKGYAQVLVQFSLTELPQLWNVLNGEMSLVGPRPESPDRVRHYSVWQRQRLSVRPGLTGLAQVRGLREQHSSEEKARFDLQYIGQWSLFLDLSLLLQTAWALCVRLIKEDRFGIMSGSQSKLTHEFGARRMVHADSAQPGAD